jgi:hypothetical protein
MMIPLFLVAMVLAAAGQAVLATIVFCIGAHVGMKPRKT